MENNETEKRSRGRPLGSKNKRTEELFDQLSKLPGWKHPAEFLAEQMISNTDVATQIKCALELLPYLAPKLKQVEVSGPDGGPISNAYTWLPPEPEGSIPMATEGMSMDDLDEEEEDE